MESQMHRPVEQETVEGQGEQGGKMSVLKKVKEKAKKLKGSIKKHGSNSGQEEDGSDEEMDTSPAVHGAPGMTPPPTQGGDLEKPADAGGFTSLKGDGGVDTPPQAAEREFNFPKHEDVSPTDYQTRDVDSSGQDVGSLTQGLKDMNVGGDESKAVPEVQEQPRSTPAAAEETHLPQSHPVPAEDEPKKYDPNRPDSTPQDTTYIGKITSVPAVIVDKAAAAKNVVASKLGYGANNQAQEPTTTPDVVGGGGAATQQKKPLTETAAEYKNMVAEKLGYGASKAQESVDVGGDGGATQQKKPLTETAAEYKNMVAEKLAPVYGKVSGAGTGVISRVRGTGAGEQTQGGDEAAKGSYLSEKLKPGDEDKALSKAITEKLQLTGNKPTADESKAATEASPGVVGSIKGVVGSLLGGKSNNGSESAGGEQPQSLGSEGIAAREGADVVEPTAEQ